MKAYTMRLRSASDIYGEKKYSKATKAAAEQLIKSLVGCPYKEPYPGDRLWEFWSNEPVPTLDEFREEMFDDDDDEKYVSESYKDYFGKEALDWFLITVRHTDNENTSVPAAYGQRLVFLPVRRY